MTSTPNLMGDKRQERADGGFRLTLLGHFALTAADGSPVIVSNKKNRAILAILALSPGYQTTRERICGLLWADRGEEQARSSLRQSLTVLRKELGDTGSGLLQTVDDRISLRPDVLAIDTASFLSLSQAQDAATLVQAAALYQGQLLADTSVREPSFDDWLAKQRRRLVDCAIEVLDRLTSLGEVPHRTDLARQLVNLDPLREASHRALMRAYAESGETALALQQFEACRAMLKAEFQVDPADETQTLRTAIANGKLAKPLSADAPTLERAPYDISFPEKTPSVPTDKPSIAVLPFTSQGGTPEPDYISDGITESVIDGLGRYHDLFVIDRVSSFTFKGKSIKSQDAARQLGVGYILTGSLQTSGGRIRITTELVEGGTGRQIWSNRYEREANDVFAIQDEVTEAITATLMAGYGGRLRKAWTARKLPIGVERLEAMDLFQQALEVWDFTASGMERARGYLQKAIGRDPGFAKAYGKMAWSYMVDASYGLTADHQASMDKAYEWAVRGIAADDGDSWARWSLASHHMLSGRHELALEEFRRALDCNPNDAEVMTDHGLCLTYAGRSAEGIEVALKAMRLNPFHYEWYTAQLGQIYFDARQYEKALSTFAKLRWMDSALMRIYQAASFAALDRFDEARASIRRILQLDPAACVEKWASKHLAPYVRQDDTDHLRSALRKAGLPETAQIVPQQTSERPSIAVLPFDNLTGDPSHDLICDGISRNITDDLARFRDLFVVASDSAFVYRAPNGGTQAISHNLGVRYVLAGSIMLSGNQLRIQPRLIDGRSGQQVWSQSYDGQPESIFSLQDSLTSTIASTLATAYGGQLLKIWQRRPERAATRSMTAIDLFHRGMEKLNRFTNEDNEAARKLFAEAASHDPNYAKPLAKIAWTHLVEVVFGWASDVPSSVRHSQEYAQKAVLIDPDEPWSYWSLAGQYQFQGDFDRAIASYERALELNPNDADVMTDYGWCLSFSGRPEEGLAMALKAIKLNPHHPEWYIFQLAQLQFNARKYGDAVKTTRRLREVDAGIVQAYLAASYAALDYRVEAECAVTRLLALDPVASVERYTSPEMATYRLDADLRHFRDCLSKAGLRQSQLFIELGDSKGSSIAVLPFTNMSGDAEQEYFSDGITEDVITELSRFRNLFVIARNSSFTFKGRAVNVIEVGRELGVGFVVEGSVRHLGGRIRITAQLVSTLSGSHIWAERYDRPYEDLFDVQDEVVSSIAATVEGRLAIEVANRAAVKPKSVSAYELVLQARQLMGTYDIEAARPLLRKALALDPKYARAQAWLAWVYMIQFFGDLNVSTIDEAVAIGRRSVELDPDDSLCHAILGCVFLFAQKFELADVQTRQALEANPADGLAMSIRAQVLCRTGHVEEALRTLAEVLRRDPYPPSWYWENLAVALLTSRRYEEVIATINRKSRVFWWDHYVLGVCHAYLGKTSQAESEMAALRRLRPTLTIQQVMLAEPYKNTTDAQHLINGLRRAGLPD